jgi:3-oxoacyl-[acyl-carrier protein] reductase
MDSELGGKVALVTGASRAIALELAAEGVDVGISGRDRATLEVVRVALESSKGKVVEIEADVTRPEDIGSAVKEFKKQLGRIDILVNNAGDVSLGSSSIPLKSVDLSDEDWRFSVETNFLSAVQFTREVVPVMRKQGGGAIVNVSSIWVIAGGLIRWIMSPRRPQ